ncbi:hypothetical protein JKP88DRAFT_274718 [Tribonema minus]|uniref:Uncharacterized protein n=1 Tax=Tribonema minus TaxID=303371 RepID=A0A835ZKJ1_9STRA|nr:hypothetical protein JKP88DRAFT_274718 [Tribonema minus]
MDILRLTALLLALSYGVASHDSARLPVADAGAALPSVSAAIPVAGARRRSLASAPSGQPAAAPTRRPTRKPTTVQPTTVKPTTAKPTTAKPTAKPTRKPTAKPTVAATTRKPTRKPTSKPTPPRAGYNIQFVFAPGTTADVKALFATAAARWTSIITADVPDVPSDGTDWFYNLFNVAYTGPVDDVVIAAAVTYIADGPGTILGSAGPIYVRSDSQLPISGIMKFDQDDVAGLIADGSFIDVLLHEMGHVLGVGTVWPTTTASCGGMCVVPSSSSTTTARAYYDDGHTGTCYAQVKAAELGIEQLELEANGRPGTACGHWDEAQLCTELMTGYLNGPGSELSVITIAAAVAAAEAAAAAAAAAGDGEEEVESGVAFHLIEQEDLVAAFAALGADLPNRKALAGTMLNKEHDRVSRDVWEAIDALHLGGSYFVTTEPARGVCKNAEWIEELHMRWAKKVTRGNLDRLLGMVMDNTKANRKALDLMKQKHPTWLLLGCQAHALALLIKDLHGEKNARCDWSKKAYGKALMMSNTINGSETIHSALREQQKFKYGKVKAVRSHCPTRFAILHFICSDLLDSEEAIKLMVGDRSWGLQDLGYQVDYTKADAFDPAVCTSASRDEGAIIWNSEQVVRPTPRLANIERQVAASPAWCPTPTQRPSVKPAACCAKIINANTNTCNHTVEDWSLSAAVPAAGDGARL